MKPGMLQLENEYNEKENRLFKIEAETPKAYLIKQDQHNIWLAKSVLKSNPSKHLHTGAVKTTHKILPYWYMNKNKIVLN